MKGPRACSEISPGLRRQQTKAICSTGVIGSFRGVSFLLPSSFFAITRKQQFQEIDRLVFSFFILMELQLNQEPVWKIYKIFTASPLQNPRTLYQQHRHAGIVRKAKPIHSACANLQKLLAVSPRPGPGW
ncbi:hypothetical protein J3458_000505 [Metarhizium acridum]|uniref:uncharacterized protein n=1 Tax=Metarhizium acridum TaxID=92637 RepID=UPI001C6B78A9|nr:hypothetical protein J3458_000505 [Metarhizium acridum]